MATERACTDRGFLDLKRLIVQQRSLDCDHYKDGYLQRRFAVRMRARGADGYDAYVRLLKSDPLEYDELMRDLTINVTQFFRDRAVFKVLEEEVLPLLIYDKAVRGEASIRIWSAGCSSGEEPYSMAILLRELLGEEFPKFNVTIVGSDIDGEVLQSAQEGRYLPRQVVNVPKAYLDRYFELDGDLYQICPEIMSMVKFRSIDLFTSTAGSHFDMILCRNVVIYFNREMQERLYMGFFRSLKEGGYFVMGNTETLVGEASKVLSPAYVRERIYQKRSCGPDARP
ncbi:MAG: protein-glutamate O-methyltransferase CheR [Methanomassiliicoccus sp.]|nr:protein-glutamate O-methyltransferase CheR [Methanomassiliicoccus sp.]